MRNRSAATTILDGEGQFLNYNMHLGASCKTLRVKYNTTLTSFGSNVT